MTIKAVKPTDMPPGEKAAFIDFVLKAGEVDEATLPVLVDRAVALVAIHDGETLIGTAAVKHPSPGYRTGNFKKAGHEKLADAHPLELGWVHVHVDHRKKNHGRALVSEAMMHTGGQGIYATTKHDGMRKILPESGFVAVGRDFPSALKPDEKLSLFACAPAKVEK